MGDLLETFLHAAKLGRADILDSVLKHADEHQVDLTQCGPDGRGAMQIACEARKIDAIRMLLKSNFVLDVDTADPTVSPYESLAEEVHNVFQLELFQLVAQGQADRVIHIIDSKMDPRATMNGESLLQWAHNFERDELVVLLEDRINRENKVDVGSPADTAATEGAASSGAPNSHGAASSGKEICAKDLMVVPPSEFTTLELGVWPPIQTCFVTSSTYPLPPSGSLLSRLAECTIDAPASCMGYLTPLGNPSQLAYVFADDNRPPDITLRLSPLVDGYTLVVSPSRAEIVGDSEASLKFGCQTLRALESNSSLRDNFIIAKDKPASKLRGLYIDVGRLRDDGHFGRYAVLKCAENWHITHLFYPLGDTPIDTTGFSLQFVPVLSMTIAEPFMLDNVIRNAVVQTAPRGEAFGNPGRVMLGLRPGPDFTTPSLVARVLDVCHCFHRPPLIALFLDQCPDMLQEDFYPAFLSLGISDCVFVTGPQQVSALEHWGFTTCLFTPSESVCMPPYVMPRRERVRPTGHAGRIIEVDVSHTFCGFEQEICIYSMFRAAGDLWNLKYEWSINMMEALFGDAVNHHRSFMGWLWEQPSHCSGLYAAQAFLRMEVVDLGEEELKELFLQTQKRSTRLQEIEREDRDMSDNQVLERMRTVSGLCLEWIKWCCRIGLLLLRHTGGLDITNFDKIPKEKQTDIQNMYIKQKEKCTAFHRKWGEAPWPERSQLEVAMGLHLSKEGGWTLINGLTGRTPPGPRF
eukprot:GEMP01008010.1.p1 GENE.GEMP01008010.1~~GEMP01008010.1.p1  ORF type:complete len:749 (+),score=150.39 GEMP01008010.1:226-2472(+)